MTKPLEGLDAVAFEDVEDAYGPADEVPARLREILNGGQAAERALKALAAGLWHQGTFSPAEPLAMPFLVRLAIDPGVPDRHAILRSLVQLVSSGEEDFDRGFEPFVYRTTPLAPEYDEAIASIEAIRAALPAYRALLHDIDPRVRVQAALLARALAPSDVRDDIAGVVAREPEALVRASLLIALREPDLHSRPDEDDVVRTARSVTRALVHAPLDGADFDAIGRALATPPLDADLFPLAAGRYALIAAAALADLDAREEVRMLAVARPTMRARLARREHDDVTRTLLSAVVRAVFRPLAGRTPATPILRAELDGAQLELCAIARDADLALPVAGLPWRHADTMARYLTEGPLDRRLAIAGEEKPVWVWLHEASARPTGDDGLLDTVCSALGAWSDEDLFWLATDVYACSYPVGGSRGYCVSYARWSSFVKVFSGRVEHLPKLAEQYAEALFARAPRYKGDEPSRIELELAFGSWQATPAKTPPRAAPSGRIHDLRISLEPNRAELEHRGGERIGSVTWTGALSRDCIRGLVASITAPKSAIVHVHARDPETVHHVMGLLRDAGLLELRSGPVES